MFDIYFYKRYKKVEIYFIEEKNNQKNHMELNLFHHQYNQQKKDILHVQKEYILNQKLKMIHVLLNQSQVIKEKYIQKMVQIDHV